MDAVSLFQRDRARHIYMRFALLRRRLARASLTTVAPSRDLGGALAEMVDGFVPHDQVVRLVRGDGARMIQPKRNRLLDQPQRGAASRSANH